MSHVTQSSPPVPSPSSSTELSQVARFEHQVTGVAVAKDGRIFVNFPRWSEDAPVSVAEVMKEDSKRDVARSQKLVEACFNSSDYHEGRKAFMEKRKPVFTGT